VTQRTPPPPGAVSRRGAFHLESGNALVEIAPTPDAVRIEPNLPDEADNAAAA
jgi:hypothetical protein